MNNLPQPIINKLKDYLNSTSSLKAKEYQCQAFIDREDLDDEVRDQANQYVSEFLRSQQNPSTSTAPLKLSSKGKIKKTPDNLQRILSEHAAFHGSLKMNELDHCVYYRGKRLQDVDYTNIRCTISDKLDLVFSEPDIIRATEQVASQNAFHPVRNYLNSLTWDQKDYIPDLAECLEVAYQDSDHQALVQRMLLKFLVSCVARAFEPGCKVDTILVLKGDQGCRKSTFLRKLAVMDDWFSDQQIDIDHKDSQETIQGKWIMEFGEFYSLKKKEADSIKAFLSRQVDDFRKAYGRGNQQYPRQVVFTGSTNNDEFLTDNVNRRFWVVSVGKIDTDRFEKVRAQLWAQAVAAYKQGETHYLNEQDQELMNQYVNDYRNQDVWTDQVIEWIAQAHPSYIIISDMLTQCFNIPREKQRMKDSYRLAGILRNLGWSKSNHRINGELRKVWVNHE